MIDGRNLYSVWDMEGEGRTSSRLILDVIGRVVHRSPDRDTLHFCSDKESYLQHNFQPKHTPVLSTGSRTDIDGISDQWGFRRHTYRYVTVNRRNDVSPIIVQMVYLRTGKVCSVHDLLFVYTGHKKKIV